MYTGICVCTHDGDFHDLTCLLCDCTEYVDAALEDEHVPA